MKKKLIKSFIFLFMLISFIYFLSLNGFIKISSNYAIENNENKINCNDDYAYILIKVKENNLSESDMEKFIEKVKKEFIVENFSDIILRYKKSDTLARKKIEDKIISINTVSYEKTVGMFDNLYVYTSKLIS